MAQVTCTGCRKAFSVSIKYCGTQPVCWQCRGREPGQIRRRNDPGIAAHVRGPSGAWRQCGTERCDKNDGCEVHGLVPESTSPEAAHHSTRVDGNEATQNRSVSFMEVVAQCKDFIHMVWPASRVLAGTRVCRQLRDLFGSAEPLALHATLQMKPSCSAHDIASMNLCRFRATQTQISGIRRELSDIHRHQTAARPFLSALLAQTRDGTSSAPIVSLDLMYSNIDQDTASEFLAPLVARCPNLRELNLSWNNIGSAGLAAIFSALKQHAPHIRELKLGGNELGTQGARMLAEFIAGGRHDLRCLDVHNNLIGPEGAGAIAAALPSCPALTHLDVSDNFCGREGAASFAEALPRCGRLAQLDLWNCRVGSAGALTLARVLPRCSSLLQLTLRGNAIGDDGGVAIAEALPSCSSLLTLDLRTNKLSNASAQALARALSSPPAPPAAGSDPEDASAVTTDSPMPSFQVGTGPPALRQPVPVRTVQLDHNRIEDAGATALAAALAGCAAPLRVHLSRNLIGEAGRARLLAAFPSPEAAVSRLNLWEAERLLRARGTVARAERVQGGAELAGAEHGVEIVALA